MDYYLLLVILSIPFWIFGSRSLPLPINLPASALMLINPVLAASILTYRQAGLAGLAALFKRVFDYRRVGNRLWYLPALLIYPLIQIAVYGILRLAGAPLPKPQTPLWLAPASFPLFFIAAACEELGWMGYAVEPLQNRYGALAAGLVLGAVWGLWHAIPYVQQGENAGWIVWQIINTIAQRVLIVWIYNNAGKSVFTAILYHAMSNVSTYMFPNFGSHFNPFVTAVLTTAAAIVVVAGWGPRTLARFRFAAGRAP